MNNLPLRLQTLFMPKNERGLLLERPLRRKEGREEIGNKEVGRRGESGDKEGKGKKG